MILSAFWPFIAWMESILRYVEVAQRTAEPQNNTESCKKLRNHGAHQRQVEHETAGEIRAPAQAGKAAGEGGGRGARRGGGG